MNPRINIRLASQEDVEQMLAIYTPFVEDTTVSFETIVPNRKTFAERLEKNSPWLVCTWDKEVAGYAYACPHRSRGAYEWSKELSVYVHPDFRRKGIASVLYRVIITILKEQGYCNVLAGITLPNPTSLSFHVSIGFQPVGIYRKVGYKFNAWQDVSWWQMFLQDPSKSPLTPIPLQQFMRTEKWKTIIDEGEKQLLLRFKTAPF